MEILSDLKNIETSTILTILFIIVAMWFACRMIIPNNKKTLQRKLVIGFLSFGTFIVIYFLIERDINYRTICSNYSVAKGKISNYFVTNRKGHNGSFNSIKYNYIVKNDTLTGNYSENRYVEIPDEKPDIKIDYLVIYENGNFENSFILLNYPIKDSADFIKYQKQFKDKIPENVFKK